MGDSWNDAAMQAYDADLTDAELARAQTAADGVASDFNRVWHGSLLGPDVSVDLDVGGDDRRVFIFSLNVDLDDDLAASDYPMDALQELASDLRTRVAASPVDRWAWLVTIGTKAGTTR